MLEPPRLRARLRPRVLLRDRDRAQRCRELARVGRPIVGILREQADHDRFELRRQPALHARPQLRHRIVDVRVDRALFVGPREHFARREQPPRHAAERVEVTPRIGAGTGDHLGRDVARRSHDRTGLRQLRRARQVDLLRSRRRQRHDIDRIRNRIRDRVDDAEVEHLRDIDLVGRAGQVDVRRLDIAVEQTCVVRLGERLAGVHEDLDHARGRLRPEIADQAIEIETVEQLHHIEERAVIGDAVIEQRDRVPRPHRGERLRLAPEPLLRLRAMQRISERIGPHELHCGVSGEQPVLRAPHLAHPAHAEPRDKAVRAHLSHLGLRLARALACRGHRAAHAHEVPREHQRHAQRHGERPTRGEQALLLELLRRAEQRSLRHQRREVPVERRLDARALAAERRHRCEVLAIVGRELEELLLAQAQRAALCPGLARDRERRDAERSKQRIERDVTVVGVAQQAGLLGRRRGHRRRGKREDRPVAREQHRAGTLERRANDELRERTHIEVHGGHRL